MPFDYEEYRKKCDSLSVEQLQKEWEGYTRQIAGGSTSTATSVLCSPITGGVSLLGLGIAGPRIHNARKKREIIEASLQARGTTHQTRTRDVAGGIALSGAIGGLTFGLLGPGTAALVSVAAEGAGTAVEQKTGSHIKKQGLKEIELRQQHEQQQQMQMWAQYQHQQQYNGFQAGQGLGHPAAQMPLGVESTQQLQPQPFSAPGTYQPHSISPQPPQIQPMNVFPGPPPPPPATSDTKYLYNNVPPGSEGSQYFQKPPQDNAVTVPQYSISTQQNPSTGSEFHRTSYVEYSVVQDASPTQTLPAYIPQTSISPSNATKPVPNQIASIAPPDGNERTNSASMEAEIAALRAKIMSMELESRSAPPTTTAESYPPLDANISVEGGPESTRTNASSYPPEKGTESNLHASAKQEDSKGCGSDRDLPQQEENQMSVVQNTIANATSTSTHQAQTSLSTPSYPPQLAQPPQPIDILPSHNPYPVGHVGATLPPGQHPYGHPPLDSATTTHSYFPFGPQHHMPLQASHLQGSLQPYFPPPPSLPPPQHQPSGSLQSKRQVFVPPFHEIPIYGNDLQQNQTYQPSQISTQQFQPYNPGYYSTAPALSIFPPVPNVGVNSAPVPQSVAHPQQWIGAVSQSNPHHITNSQPLYAPQPGYNEIASGVGMATLPGRFSLYSPPPPYAPQSHSEAQGVSSEKPTLVQGPPNSFQPQLS